MHDNKYLLITCCALVLFAITVRHTKIREVIQTHGYGSVVQTEKRDTTIDENILIKDQPAAVASSTPATIVKEQKPRPYVSAESYIVANLDTGETYLSLNSRQVFPIASVSKLYTALVVQHLFDSDMEIQITQSMLDAYGDAGKLVLDEKFTADELLYALLLESSNDAAEAYAQSFGYQEFMEEMNGFAKEIGLEHTSFRDASGLSPYNVSNATDLFTLSRYLYGHEKDILKISKTTEYDLATTSDHDSHHFVNINPYSAYSSFVGGKTGRTDEAKESMITLIRQEVGDETYPIAIILLRSEFGQREIDTEKLLGLFVDKVQKK